MKAMNRFSYYAGHACNVFCNAYDLLSEMQYPLIQAWKTLELLKIDYTTIVTKGLEKTNVKTVLEMKGAQELSQATLIAPIAAKEIVKGIAKKQQRQEQEEKQQKSEQSEGRLTKADDKLE